MLVAPSPGDAAGLAPASAGDLLQYVARRMSLGDALIASSFDGWTGEATTFVSWDARHFRGKISPPVLTPAKFLDRG